MGCKPCKPLIMMVRWRRLPLQGQRGKQPDEKWIDECVKI